MASELSGFEWGYRVYPSVLSALVTAQNALWDGLISSMRSLQLSFRNSRTRAFTSRWRARALDLYSGVGYALARRKAAFLLLSIREYRAETSGDPRMPEPPARSPRPLS
ncbi:hypothetical protein EVAR_36171_1 [Eumeta japonica]|uniref:Uncharacterized protein n=1 Tax=Eumeta variegata TaxID=151549 RepID=A0A4C1VUB5_EUMVA|nr:hypothetical protein EVAR_36171_1 [Eumeta japonica]